MADIAVMELWLERRKLDALESSLRKRGTSAEEQLRKLFLRLYTENVPLPVQARINKQIQQEEKMAAADDSEKTTAYHVTQNGRQRYFITGTGSDALITALCVADYLSQPSGTNFEDLLSDRIPASEEAFHQLALLHLEGSPSVTGVFELDFDKQEFAFVDPENGWRAFAMSSVRFAVQHVERKRGLSHEQTRALLLKNLESWALLSPGHLPKGAISFEKMEFLPGRLSFPMDTDTDFGSMDSLFRTNTHTGENTDCMGVYASCDLSTGEVCQRLEAVLIREDYSMEILVYPLNPVENECLRQRMDDYCQRQTGMCLAAHIHHFCLEHTDFLTPRPTTAFKALDFYAKLCVSKLAEQIAEIERNEQQAPEKDMREDGPDSPDMGPVMG